MTLWHRQGERLRGREISLAITLYSYVLCDMWWHLVDTLIPHIFQIVFFNFIQSHLETKECIRQWVFNYLWILDATNAINLLIYVFPEREKTCFVAGFCSKNGRPLLVVQAPILCIYDFKNYQLAWVYVSWTLYIWFYRCTFKSRIHHYIPQECLSFRARREIDTFGYTEEPIVRQLSS